jgi:hypothetical protein
MILRCRRSPHVTLFRVYILSVTGCFFRYDTLLHIRAFLGGYLGVTLL